MRKNAFTLIELLVVIAIIAILASLVIPVAITALESAKATKETRFLNQLGNGITQYLNQNEDTMWGTAGDSGSGTWPTTLHQFVPDWRTFQSPFDNRAYTGTAPYSVSFGFNASLYGVNGSKIHYASQLIVLAGAYNAGSAFTGTSQANVQLQSPLPPGSNGRMGGTFRNGSLVNALYWDSHVQPVRVVTYNDTTSTAGQEQWNPFAP